MNNNKMWRTKSEIRRFTIQTVTSFLEYDYIMTWS